ncbi:MAG: hypothetical protein KJI71_05810 [Patescibacteria group bacterium]|nr:hypothetical protein [Patescibacteria group bacterium]
MNINYSIQKIRRHRELQGEKSRRIKNFVALAVVLFIGIFIGSFFVGNEISLTGYVTGNLPDVGESNWGTILNNYLLQEHTTNGTHGNVTAENLNVSGNFNLIGNLSVGDKITFRLGEIIDNIVDGFITITGGLNVSGEINSTGLNVNGNINLTGNLTDSSGGIISIPSGAVMYFNLTTCPTGWNEMVSAQGRYLVGVSGTGRTIGDNGIAGTAFTTNLENRTVGEHTHTFTGDDLPTHTHILQRFVGAGGSTEELSVKFDATGQSPLAAGNVESVSAGTPTGTNTENGSVAGTNAPYIQLLVCVKN